MSLNTHAKVLWSPGTGLQTTRTGKLITSADSSLHIQITNLCCKSADWGQVETRSPDLHWASSLLWHIAEQAHFPLYAGWPVKHLLMAPIWASLFLHTLPHTIGLWGTSPDWPFSSLSLQVVIVSFWGWSLAGPVSVWFSADIWSHYP